MISNASKPPVPKAPWIGERAAIKDGSQCTQLNLFFRENEDQVVGNEDCLYLNVYTPSRFISFIKMNTDIGNYENSPFGWTIIHIAKNFENRLSILNEFRIIVLIQLPNRLFYILHLHYLYTHKLKLNINKHKYCY